MVNLIGQYTSRNILTHPMATHNFVLSGSVKINKSVINSAIDMFGYYLLF